MISYISYNKRLERDFDKYVRKHLTVFIEDLVNKECYGKLQ